MAPAGRTRLVRNLWVSAVFSDPVGSKVHPPPPSANYVRGTIGADVRGE